MFKLDRVRSNIVTKSITVVSAAGLSTMIPMHVNASNVGSYYPTYVSYLYGGAVCLALGTATIYAICTKKEHTEKPPKTRLDVDNDNITENAKKYFKIVNR